MKNETILRGLLAFALLGLIFMVFEYFQKDAMYNELKQSTSHKISKKSYDSLLNENKILINANDSIRSELFVKQTIIMRYDMGLDFLKERRPNEYILIMNFINTQTE
jgi:hypothetical protein